MNRRLKRTLFWISVLLLPSTASGGEKPGLRAFAEAAIANDPVCLSALDELRAAEADAAAERADRLLDGSVSAGIGKTGGTVSAERRGITGSGSFSASTAAPAGSKISAGAKYDYLGDGSDKSDSATFNAGVSVPVFVNGRLVDARLNAAAKASAVDIPLEAARETFEQARRNAVDSVLRLALAAASAERSASLAERAAGIAERETVIADVRRQQGAISFSELSKIVKDADQARLDALEARMLRDRKMRSLCSATGFGESDIDLALILAPADGFSPDIPRDTVVSKEMRGASRARKAAEMNRVLAGAEGSPSMGLSSSYTVAGPASRAGDADGSAWSVSASLTLPLPTGALSSRKKAADARLSAALQNESAARTAADDRLASLKDAWTAALAREKLRGQILEQAEIRLRESESAFNSRTATRLDVDSAGLAVDQAASALEDERLARFEAVLDLYAFCGLDPLDLL